MITAWFNFHGALSNFLSRSRRGVAFPLIFSPHQSLKHLIESVGIPHTEIGQVLVNGQVSELARRMRDGDYVDVYPIQAAQPLENARFVLDGHLGRLAIYLRMLGFDSLYCNDYEDETLAQIADQDGRILLTRDRRLLMRKQVTNGYCVPCLDPRQQVIEVLQRFNLFAQVRPLHRCLRCNAPLEVVSKSAVLDQLKPLTKRYFDEFRRCSACGQVYWKGSHYDRMLEQINSMIKAKEENHKR
ncbi:MAG: Mut7-C ubiquitin/RNAse domain-containing protein [Anaerolineales bacterium]|nr:Mut7-C ubiquitin/RNAse domain-containing protein [Anaerolineales bacterium]